MNNQSKWSSVHFTAVNKKRSMRSNEIDNLKLLFSEGACERVEAEDVVSKTQISMFLTFGFIEETESGFISSWSRDRFIIQLNAASGILIS